MAPNIGEDFVRWSPPTGGDETLGMVGFCQLDQCCHWFELSARNPYSFFYYGKSNRFLHSAHFT